MPIAIQILFLLFAAIFSTLGALMIVAPTRYPNLYDGFLRENVMRSQSLGSNRQNSILLGVL
jgi:hypothetical protein